MKERLFITRRRVIAMLLAVGLLLSGILGIGSSVFGADKKDEENESNRYNLVIVMDASGSMHYGDNKGTDPEGRRFGAASLFVNMLPNEGNYLGSVVFATDIVDVQPVKGINGTTAKKEFLDGISEDIKDDTNIGLALDKAVDLLEDGDPSLPSVILLLSDGKTDLPTDEEMEKSIDLKEEAIQEARKKGIRVFCVCLNVNGEADPDEMRHIADSTNGLFQEVREVRDLISVFNAFYNEIYGTSTITLLDSTFNDKGEIEGTFELPTFGVDEVNIVIYGDVEGDVTVYDPMNKPVAITQNTIETDDCTIVKFTDIVGGKWRVVAKGEPSTPVKVNMVYNSDLVVDVSTDKDLKNVVYTDQEVKFNAKLKHGSEVAETAEQYSGYEANLEIQKLDPTTQEKTVVKTIPMTSGDGGYTAAHIFDEGVYYFQVKVTSPFLNRNSRLLGPIEVEKPPVNVDDKDKEPVPPPITNTAPSPVESEVKYEITLWPFKSNELVIDVSGLATDPDPEDSKLVYKIESTSFRDDDYTYDEGKGEITITHYSVRKGAFTIRAYDRLGEYCEIEILVKSISVATIILIGLGVLAVIVIAVIVFFARRATLPLRGRLTVTSSKRGLNKTDKLDHGHGSIRLGKFNIDNVGQSSGTHFRATGKNYIYLIAKPGARVGMGQTTKKKIVITDGHTEKIFWGDDPMTCLMVKYEFTGKKKQHSTRPGQSTPGRGARPIGGRGTRPAGGRGSRPTPGRSNGGPGVRR